MLLIVNMKVLRRAHRERFTEIVETEHKDKSVTRERRRRADYMPLKPWARTEDCAAWAKGAIWEGKALSIKKKTLEAVS